MAKSYTLEKDLAPIIKGEVLLPNPEPITKDVGATILRYHQMLCGVARLPDRKEWGARFFLDYGQNGGLQGSGVVAWVEWKDGPWKEAGYRAVGMTFAICRHTPVPGTGANPSRGWHPARCSKCGLDLSVDSGD